MERFQRDGAGRPEEQGTGMAAGAWIMKSYMLYRLRPFRMNAVVASMSSLQGFKGFRFSFYRGNVSFVLVASFRARLFLFPVPCSLFASLGDSANASTNQYFYRSGFHPCSAYIFIIHAAAAIPVPCSLFPVPYSFVYLTNQNL